MRTNRFAKLFFAGLTAATLGACSADVAEPLTEVEDAGTEIEGAEEALWAKNSVIWQQLSIPVCWENPSAGDATARAWVQNQVSVTWQAASQVRFTGWGTCPSTATSGLRILIHTGISQTSSLGRSLNGVTSGVKLNLSLTGVQGYINCKNLYGAEACVRKLATHEFGHALGFAHEEMRPDSQLECGDLGLGTPGDTYVGAYDRLSIMNSCRVNQTGGTTLSDSDKAAIQVFYGSPSTSARRDAFASGSVIYSFVGKNYAGYDTATGKLVDLSAAAFYYPAPISGSWGGWPTSGTWPSGTDAALAFGGNKVYFFNGSQYARYDLAADTMDGGYPKSLPGGWVNWPTTWTSVNAGFKRADGKVYIFRGSEYLRISAGTTVDTGYPKAISGNWGNMPFSSGVDASIGLSNGKVYFLKGSQFVLFNPSTNQVEQGPVAITGRLPGVMY